MALTNQADQRRTRVHRGSAECTILLCCTCLSAKERFLCFSVVPFDSLDRNEARGGDSNDQM
jgi:hypothetical protein